MSLRNEALSGVFWSFLQQFGTQITTFVVNLVLARLLMPSDFGIVAIFNVLMAIGYVFIDSGLTNSLIRSKYIDEEDTSTVFYFNLIISVLVYIFFLFSSPALAYFFNIPDLSAIIRVYTLILPINTFAAIQRTVLTKKMDFKTQLKVELPSLLIGGIVGIILALLRFGVWSLVFMGVIQAILSSLQFWLYSKWRPKRIFNKKKFKYHFNFGYKLALSGLIDTIFRNIYTLIIGKIFNTSQLGFYNKANSMQQLTVTSIIHPLNKVTYPLFAKIKDDDIRLKNIYSQLMKMVIFIVAPMLILMGVLGEPLFRFLYTEKWLSAVPYFQILCISGILLPIHSYNLNILKVKGRSDLFLKLEIFKKILTVIVISITFRFGIIAILWGSVVTSVIGLAINCHYSGKFLKYNLWKQLADLLPGLFLSICVGAVILLLDRNIWIAFSDYIRLITGGVSGLLLYIGFAYIFKFKELTDAKEILFRKKK